MSKTMAVKVQHDVARGELVTTAMLPRMPQAGDVWEHICTGDRWELSRGTDGTLLERPMWTSDPPHVCANAGRAFLDFPYYRLVSTAAPAPADWRDAYPVGSECEVNGDLWRPGSGWVRGTVRERKSGTKLRVLTRDASIGLDGSVRAPGPGYLRPLAPPTPAADKLAAEAEAIGRAFLSPPKAPPPCPFCTHALHTAHTVDVLRCEACGWAGSEEQRGRTSAPPKAEPLFKPGDWVRARETVISEEGHRVVGSSTMQVMSVRGESVAVSWSASYYHKEEKFTLRASDLVATERPR